VSGALGVVTRVRRSLDDDADYAAVAIPAAAEISRVAGARDLRDAPDSDNADRPAAATPARIAGAPQEPRRGPCRLPRTGRGQPPSFSDPPRACPARGLGVVIGPAA
jgi:hypothetical protein